MSKVRKTTRPKGYMLDWKPTAEIALIISWVLEILHDYRDYGPMTVRQIFYRLVAEHGYAKDELAYKRLAETLVKARRAQMIPFGKIRDDGTVTHSGRPTTSKSDVWDILLDTVGDPHGYLHLNRRTNQAHHIELWCEAGGMAPMLAQMVRRHDVSVYSTGGFSSVTVTHEIAKRVCKRSKPTYFLHVGDHDPSGQSIFTSMSQDVGSFVVQEFSGEWNQATGETLSLKGDRKCLFIPQRVALTEEQVEEHDLPTAPPKRTDSRSANWYGETTQAEAMPPTLLEEIVVGAIDDLTDQKILDDLIETEKKQKEEFRAAVEDEDVEDIISRLGLANPTLLEVFEALRETDGVR